jgi:nucleotide-binding universal stress UspA family protein
MATECDATFLPVKKIVCPTDFSEPACRALKAAAEIAEAAKAELLLVHVVAPIPALDSPSGAPAFDLAGYQDELVRSAKAALEERRRKRVPESVRSRAIVSIGDAAHEVTRIALEEGADLIVIATHGRTGWHLRLFGSVAEKVVRLARCAVLTVPCHPEDTPTPR